MPIDTQEPYSDGWWLDRCYKQLRPQAKRCQLLLDRYNGNAPLPFVADAQREAVKWFVQKSRTNFERVIVTAVLSRLNIRGIRTAVDDDEGGDADAFRTWKAARGKLVAQDANEMALSMSLGFIIVGKDPVGGVVVTAEDPRLVTAITDPADPYRALAALKLSHDDVADQDVARLFLPGGRVRVARAPRKRRNTGSNDIRFNAAAYEWDEDIVNEAGELVHEGDGGVAEWLDEQTDDAGNTLPAMVPVIPIFNGRDIESAQAQFEPFIEQIDRIFQQILQRMTIATIQAFKQRAFKGLPPNDPKTGAKLNYDEIFRADPGAVWNVPASVEIWESGQADFTSILAGIRDDVKDLYATSGTPGYLASPDAANASAEAASLQREMNTFIVERFRDRVELVYELVAELIFRTIGDLQRAQRGKIDIIWAPVERESIGERSNAVAQTKGVVPIYMQLTDIMGYDPDKADRAMSLLNDDMLRAQRFAMAAQAATGGGAAASPAPAS